MSVCSAAQTAQVPWGSQAGCVCNLNSVWGLQGAALGGCNCAEGGEHEKYGLTEIRIMSPIQTHEFSLWVRFRIMNLTRGVEFNS